MKVAVTGAAGFIGQNLCSYLEKKGYEVIPIVRTPESLPQILARLPYKTADVTCIDSLKKAFDGINIVFNLAALFNHPDKSLDDYFAVNVKGVENVIEAASSVGVKKVVHCSTVGVATGGTVPYSEQTPYCPPKWDKYETSKCEGEKAALSYYEKYSYPVSVIRPAQVYGPGDRSKTKFYKMVKNGVIVNPGKTLKHLIYIDDLCQAFEAIAVSNTMTGKAVIIAGAEATPLEELVSIVASELGVAPPRWRVPALPVTILATVVESIFNAIGKKPPIFRRSMDFFTKSVSFDTTIMKDELAFMPETTVIDGIHKTAEWYRSEGLI